jgi:hypothetical protein
MCLRLEHIILLSIIYYSSYEKVVYLNKMSSEKQSLFGLKMFLLVENDLLTSIEVICAYFTNK